MNPAQQKWQIPAEVARIPEVLKVISQSALAHGVAGAECLRLQLALEEALVNICHHAFDMPPGMLSLELVRCGQEVCVIVEDNGKPFDPSRVPAPDLTTSLNERQVGGLGIYLIRQSARDLRYRRIGDHNRLELAFWAGA